MIEIALNLALVGMVGVGALVAGLIGGAVFMALFLQWMNES